MQPNDNAHERQRERERERERDREAERERERERERLKERDAEILRDHSAPTWRVLVVVKVARGKAKPCVSQYIKATDPPSSSFFSSFVS
jgi:hypothetical protein